LKDPESAAKELERSIKKVDQAPRHSSAAAVIAGEIAEHTVGCLHALRMVTALDAPIPYSEPLENYVVPNEDKIVEAVKSVMAHEAVAA
jgi:acetoin:2,6-dichlorophenolindophenol oxidoreductase subunit beta